MPHNKMSTRRHKTKIKNHHSDAFKSTASDYTQECEDYLRHCYNYLSNYTLKDDALNSFEEQITFFGQKYMGYGETNDCESDLSIIREIYAALSSVRTFTSVPLQPPYANNYEKWQHVVPALSLTHRINQMIANEKTARLVYDRSSENAPKFSKEKLKQFTSYFHNARNSDDYYDIADD
ncbi:hypothetical protein ABN363_01720 [Providencia rettgeri]